MHYERQKKHKKCVKIKLWLIMPKTEKHILIMKF